MQDNELLLETVKLEAGSGLDFILTCILDMP